MEEQSRGPEQNVVLRQTTTTKGQRIEYSGFHCGNICMLKYHLCNSSKEWNQLFLLVFTLTDDFLLNKQKDYNSDSKAVIYISNHFYRKRIIKRLKLPFMSPQCCMTGENTDLFFPSKWNLFFTQTRVSDLRTSLNHSSAVVSKHFGNQFFFGPTAVDSVVRLKRFWASSFSTSFLIYMLHRWICVSFGSSTCPYYSTYFLQYSQCFVLHEHSVTLTFASPSHLFAKKNFQKKESVKERIRCDSKLLNSGMC